MGSYLVIPAVESMPSHSHIVCVRHLVMERGSIGPRFKEEQDALGAHRDVKHISRGGLDTLEEEEYFSVLVEAADLELLDPVEVAAETEFGRLLPAEVLPRIETGN